MKITGFTIIKNALINDYPIVEAIESVLPMVDEFIVLAGDSSDDTDQLIKNINSPKIKIHHSTWNPALKKGGVVLADETNKAFDLIGSDSDWAFYIQGDECIHEKYHSTVLAAAKEHLNNHKVEGLLFNYLHFYGTYDYIGDSRKWYNKEVRIIRNDKNIRAYRDAQGFRKNGKKLNVKQIDAWVYHYGWVKSPIQMKRKLMETGKFWHDDETLQARYDTKDVFDFTDFDSIAKFTGTHPACMKQRIEQANWNLTLDTSQKKMPFTDKLLTYAEKITGKRFFEFRNYHTI
ncbi:glycosyltransferase family protein [Flavihumibacter profundi]|uniref:glycosyltransferase family 2 protein n=1 Tax=Flavihumibacter profundi TaxID=2716883 RepID=UPI001CC4EAFA|nr:glycosyltransferase family 2 protein [Flavihumibacter profundi]MBZ5858846.1 glycosyltransferase family 2 protein [Flavihumibacter profundi]